MGCAADEASDTTLMIRLKAESQPSLRTPTKHRLEGKSCAWGFLLKEERSDLRFRMVLGMGVVAMIALIAFVANWPVPQRHSFLHNSLNRLARSCL